MQLVPAPAGPRGAPSAAPPAPSPAAVAFAAAARALAGECRRRRLPVVGYRSPPALAGVDRTLRRRPGGGAVVAVRLPGRPLVAVLADMVEGTVAAARLRGPAAAAARAALWGAVAGLASPEVGTEGFEPSLRAV